jgi:hypothetical protein
MVHKKSNTKMNLILLAALCVIVFGFYFVQNLFNIEKLPYVSNPVFFLQQFNEVSKEPVEIGWRCKFYAINCENNMYYASTFFPYSELRTVSVVPKICEQEKNVSGGSKSLLLDPFWKIFWISMFDCGKGKELFFGPYRTQNQVITKS